MKKQINKILKAQTFEYAKQLVDQYLKTDQNSTLFFSTLRTTILSTASFHHNKPNFKLLEYVEKELYARKQVQIENNESLKMSVSWAELNNFAKHCCITLLSMGCKFGQLTTQHKFFNISHKILSSGWYFKNIRKDVQRDIMFGLCKKLPEKHKSLTNHSILLETLYFKIKTAQCISLNHITDAQDILFCNPIHDNRASLLTFLLCIKSYKTQNIINVPKVLRNLICDIIILQDLDQKICVLINELENSKTVSYW